MYRFLLALPVLMLTPTMAIAQEDQEAADAVSVSVEQRAEDVLAALRGEMAYDAVFAQSFRDQVPEAQFLGHRSTIGSAIWFDYWN